jgi:hypothetical protein
MAYTVGSLYLALFKGVIYLIPGKSRAGSMRRVLASDYPKEYRAQIIVLTIMLVALVLDAAAAGFGWTSN